MFDFSGIPYKSLLGRVLRMPLRLIPRNLTVRVCQGALRGKRWVAGSSDHGCWLGSYEFDKQRLVARSVTPGTVFFDIGANVGFYTLLASLLVGDTGRVFAFEPLPRNLGYLDKHLRINGVRNVTVFRAAVSDHSGEAWFSEGRDPSQGKLSSTGTIPIALLSLDDLVTAGTVPLPHCMKIDVEGAEVSVLQGAGRVLTDGSPTVFLATHGSDVHSQSVSLLQSLGYDCRPLDATEDIGACNELVAVKAGR